MKKAEPQVPFVRYRSDDRAPHERVLDLMDMAHAKTCCIPAASRAWPRPADEPGAQRAQQHLPLPAYPTLNTRSPPGREGLTFCCHMVPGTRSALRSRLGLEHI